MAEDKNKLLIKVQCLIGTIEKSAILNYKDVGWQKRDGVWYTNSGWTPADNEGVLLVEKWMRPKSDLDNNGPEEKELAITIDDEPESNQTLKNIPSSEQIRSKSGLVEEFLEQKKTDGSEKDKTKQLLINKRIEEEKREQENAKVRKLLMVSLLIISLGVSTAYIVLSLGQELGILSYDKNTIFKPEPESKIEVIKTPSSWEIVDVAKPTESPETKEEDIITLPQDTELSESNKRYILKYVIEETIWRAKVKTAKYKGLEGKTKLKDLLDYINFNESTYRVLEEMRQVYQQLGHKPIDINPKALNKELQTLSKVIYEEESLALKLIAALVQKENIDLGSYPGKKMATKANAGKWLSPLGSLKEAATGKKQDAFFSKEEGDPDSVGLPIQWK